MSYETRKWSRCIQIFLEKHENGRRSLAIVDKHAQALGAALKFSSFFGSHVPRSMPCIGFDSCCSAPLPATKSPFLLMTNKNQTSPAPHPQNQPPDSGSVRGSQRQQLWLSLHRSHRVRFVFQVFSVFCLSLIPQGKKRRN